MALSNAIVPVLPSYDPGSAMQGLIYSAYFLGAFLITLPAGILSDRFGRVPFLRLGLAITVASGIFLAMATGAAAVLLLRFIEGIGAGLFVAAGMATVNRDVGHVRLSGWFMACLNAGLVLGLLLAGSLAARLLNPAAGIFLFTALSILPALASFTIRELPPVDISCDKTPIAGYIVKYRWLWYSCVVLVGITGVLTSLYPELSGASPEVLGFWMAGMSIATIVAVLVYSRTELHPVRAIRWSAILMAGSVLLSFYSAAGFLLIGALAGIIMIAQMAFLSSAREHQGIVMGLFSTTSYLGMALLPSAAGVAAELSGFFITFWITMLAALSVAATIGLCPSAGSVVPEERGA